MTEYEPKKFPKTGPFSERERKIVAVQEMLDEEQARDRLYVSNKLIAHDHYVDCSNPAADFSSHWQFFADIAPTVPTYQIDAINEFGTNLGSKIKQLVDEPGSTRTGLVEAKMHSANEINSGGIIVYDSSIPDGSQLISVSIYPERKFLQLSNDLLRGTLNPEDGEKYFGKTDEDYYAPWIIKLPKNS